ncbi:acyltransferase [Agreia sp. PsM10]|uniref:acyltransferase family protein n=1 Tax=Agreia sp. PsM10 TaxID=3030533 RepID=UPI00263BCE84|nr:acyltransferase [Agreia sp. PsM10]MDN4638719.1 acyltransferase [Agreia sp. PsM10]
MSNRSSQAATNPEGESVDVVEMAARSKRDLVVDLARVFCVFAVVMMHSLMVGLHRDGDTIGQINPLQTKEWFALATWVGQIMPLFFVVGGFAGAVSWRSATRRGTSPAEFLRTRLVRLLRPALPLLVFLTVVLWVLVVAGVDRALVDVVSAGVGMPLWFLAAYISCQAFLPIVHRAHASRPALTIAVLVGLSAIVDAARILSGVQEIGLINLVFVWLAVQQLGFFYADGWFARRARWQLVAGAAASYGVLAALTYGLDLYPVDMLTNLNPATVPLILLGVAQVCILHLLYPALRVAMTLKPVLIAVFFVGSRAMTIYLWHLPIIVALSGALFLSGWVDSVPGSGVWWATRPLFVLAVWAILAALSLVVARWERPPTPALPGSRTPGPLRIQIAALISFAVFAAEIQWGLSLLLLTVTTAVIAVALRLVSADRPVTADLQPS